MEGYEDENAYGRVDKGCGPELGEGGVGWSGREDGDEWDQKHVYMANLGIRACIRYDGHDELTTARHASLFIIFRILLRHTTLKSVLLGFDNVQGTVQRLICQA